MNMKKSYFITVTFVLTVILNGCKHEIILKEDCTGITPTYNSEIKAIMDVSCATPACHSGSYASAGISLDSYSSVNSESKKSRFMGSIRHTTGFAAMPQGAPKLDSLVIKKLSCWIQNGRPK